MVSFLEIEPVFCDKPLLVEDRKGQLKWVKTNDGRIFSAKSKYFSDQSVVPIRLANELLYYFVAEHNRLPIPPSGVLNISGEHYWAVEFKPERLGLTTEGVDLDTQGICQIGDTFKKSDSQLSNYLRALLLDIALLNADRATWNMLRIMNGCVLELWYFDHDRSIGWHGNKDHQYRTVREVSADISAFLGCSKIRNIAIALSTPKQLNEIFDSIELDGKLLDSARIHLSPALAWMTDEEFDNSHKLLVDWWAYLKTNFHDKVSPKIFTSVNNQPPIDVF